MKPLVDLCVFGLGPWGLSYLKTLRRVTSARVVALCDPDRSALARAEGLAPDARCFSAEADAFAYVGGRSPAGVIVATPIATHAGLARRALEHELGVLVEKPLATTRFEADRLLRMPRAIELGAVGHLLLHHPAIQELRAIVASGRIGEIRRIETLRTSRGIDRSDDVKTPALWHLAPHDVAIAVFLAGAPPGAVRACKEGDLLTLELGFGAGASAFSTIVRVARGRPESERAVRVEGERATLSFDEQRGSLRASDQVGERLFPTDLLLAQSLAFVDQLAGRARPRVSFRSGREVVACLEAAESSLARGGDWMRLEAAAEWHTPRGLPPEVAEETRRAG